MRASGDAGLQPRASGEGTAKSVGVPRAFAPPATDQAEEQARFVVMQHLNANAIGHTTLLRMRDLLVVVRHSSLDQRPA